VRVLLTGIAGFAGSYLAELLVQAPDIEVHGVVHRNDRRIAHLAGQLHLHRGDLRNALWVSEVVQAVRPSMRCIWPRGAMSAAVGSSPGRPTNSTSSASSTCWKRCAAGSRLPHAGRLLQRNLRAGAPGRSAHRRGDPFRPNSPYGVSKLTQDMMALQYFNSHRLPTMRARSFNHLGPVSPMTLPPAPSPARSPRSRPGCAAGGAGRKSQRRARLHRRARCRARLLAAGAARRAGLCYNVGSGRRARSATCSTRCSTVAGRRPRWNTDPRGCVPATCRAPTATTGAWWPPPAGSRSSTCARRCTTCWRAGEPSSAERSGSGAIARGRKTVSPLSNDRPLAPVSARYRFRRKS
jgi:GDP-4-dehydro-6-deoxy-D-mannose reductase